ATEDEFFLVVGERGGGTTQGIDSVVARGRPTKVEIVASGKNAAVALFCGCCERLWSPPGMDDDVFRNAGNENLVPADSDFAVLGDDFLHALAEVRLKFFI